MIKQFRLLLSLIVSGRFFKSSKDVCLIRSLRFLGLPKDARGALRFLYDTTEIQPQRQEASRFCQLSHVVNTMETKWIAKEDFDKDYQEYCASLLKEIFAVFNNFQQKLIEKIRS